MTQTPTASTNGHARRDHPGGRSDPSERRRRIRRAIVWTFVVLAVIVLVAAVFAGIQTIGIREQLSDGRDALDRARNALVEGDVGVAQRSFDEAAAEFDEAIAAAHGPSYRVLGFVPLLGRTPDAVQGIAEAGGELAAAGTALTNGIAQLPEGLGSLSPSAGRVPLKPIGPLAETAVTAEGHAKAALDRIEASPSTLLLGPLGEAREQAEEGIRSAYEAVHAGRLLLEGLPEFLGADGPRSYFVGAESPAELRGTGGIIGAYSILTVEDGRFRFEDFAPVQTLPGNPAAWQNVNLRPDFAQIVAPTILDQYEKATGRELDGVIEVDPFALQELLKVTGPVQIPDLDVELSADNVVAFTANEAYSRFRDPATRKEVLGAAAQEVFLRFLAGGEGIDGIRAIGTAAGGGHLTTYSTSPQMQEGLQAVHAAGDFLVPEDSDFLSVIMNNGAGNKVDYYQQRQIDYSVDLLSDRTARARTDVRITNEAPDHGLPAYVIGPFDRRFGPGETFALLDVYCAPSCTVDGAQRDGTDVEPTVGDLGGIPFANEVFSIPSGTEATLTVDTTITEGWQGNSSGGVYRLLFLGQTTVKPTQLRVQIAAPEGMELTGGSDDVDLQGDVAIWEGEPGARLELEVRFSPPVPGRWWRNITR